MTTDMVQTKANTLKKLMDAAKTEIKAALPKHVTPERMMRIALTEARKTPKLLECDQASFLGAVIQASQLGLEPGGALGHCWLIPYGREVNFQVGYRGMLELAMRSEKVSHISARAVHQGDEFEYELGLNENLIHKITGDEDGQLTHVYCVVHLKNGCKMFDVMTRAEVEKVRAKSKTGNAGPWKDHYEEMAKKSVIRRLFKMMPVSIEISKAVGLDELADAGISQNNGAFIETTSREVPEGPKSLQDKIKAQSHQEEKAVDADSSSFENFTVGEK